MTNRLPAVGGDDGNWGTILNDFLGVAHNSDGTLSSGAVSVSGGELTANKNQPSGYAGLNSSGFVPAGLLSGTFDASGSAATAQSNAESFATSAVNTETSRAEAAEALLAPIANPTFTGTTTAPEFTASGLTGAVAATRYVGRHDGAAPTTGTFGTGDFTIDATTPAIWVCTAGGSPGTWTEAGGGGGGVSSVFTRTGAIVAEKGDYTAIQVGNVVVSVTQSATPSIDTDNGNIFSIIGLAQAITSMTTNLTGTPVHGQVIWIEITDNGTARAITWGASFASTTITLPTTTAISTILRVELTWNVVNSTWDCIGVV